MTGPMTTGGVPYPLRAGKRVSSTRATMRPVHTKSSGRANPMSRGKGGKGR